MRYTLGFTPTYVRAINGGEPRIASAPPAPVAVYAAPIVRESPVVLPVTPNGGITADHLWNRPSQAAPPPVLRISESASVAPGQPGSGSGSGYGDESGSPVTTVAPAKPNLILPGILAALYFLM